MNNNTFALLPETVVNWLMYRRLGVVVRLLLSVLLYFFTFFTTVTTILAPLFSLLLTKKGAMVYREVTQNRAWLQQCELLLRQRDSG